MRFSRLLIRSPIRADECLVDYAARLANANGIRRTKQLHEALLDLDTSRRILALPASVDLTIYEPRMHQGFLSWRGAVFESSQVGASAVCPLCLDELGYRPFVWRFWAKVYCTRHETHLVDTCSACGSSLAGPGAAMMHCRCGLDLRRERTQHIACASLVAFQTAIDVAFEVHIGEPPRESDHPASTLLRSPGGLAMLASARRVALGEEASMRRGPRSWAVQVRRAHVDRLAQLLREGEISIISEARRRWTAAQSRRGRIGSHRSGFDRFTRRCEGAPATSAVRRLAERLASERADMHATKRLAAKSLNDGCLLTIGQAAERHNIDRTLLATLVSEGKIPYTAGARCGPGEGRRRLLDTRIVAELCEYRLKLLRLAEVAAMLGISVRQANQLRLRRIIRCAWDSKSSHLAEIPLEQVVRVTDRLETLARGAPPELARTLVPLDRLLPTGSDQGIAATLRAALLGDEPVYINPKHSAGLGRWCVNRLRRLGPGVQS